MSWKPEGEPVLMVVTGQGGPPSMEQAARQLGVTVEALDPDFGVVIINPDRGLYSVRVDASKLGDEFDPEKGPFSDPPIAPMR
jgi:hypothetical protein